MIYKSYENLRNEIRKEKSENFIILKVILFKYKT